MRRKHPSNGDDLESLLNNGVVGNLPKYANKITLKVWPVTVQFAIYIKGGVKSLNIIDYHTL